MPAKIKACHSTRKRVFVVDDHPMTRIGQIETFNREADLTVCGQAGTARETLEAVAKLKPDLVVTDFTLPDKSGLELLKDLQSLYPGLPVIVVSMHEEAFYAPRVLRAGGRGYVMKSEGPDRIVAAARTVLNGQIALSPAMAARALESFSAQTGKTGAAPEAALSDRELEVLRYFGEGWSTEEIAKKLHLSAKTVDVHRSHIKTKLNLRTTPEFLRFAIRWTASQERPNESGQPATRPRP